MNLNPYGGNENYITFKRPKLLRINQPIDSSSNNQNNYDFEQKNKELKKRIHELNKIHRQNKNEQENFEMNRMLACFYKNPFTYMEFLAKKITTEKGNTLENLKIKEEMNNKFSKLCEQIEGTIRDFTSNEMNKLKELEKKIDSKLNGEPIEGLSSNSNQIERKSSYNNRRSNNLKSDYMDRDEQNELLKRILGNFGSYGESGTDGVTTTGNATNFIINKKNSNLNEDNLYLNALSCLKGDKIEVPKNQFIAIKELSLKDIDQKKIKDTKNLYDLKDRLRQNQYNEIIMGKNKVENGKEIKNKIDFLKQREKKDLDDLISYSNNHINNMKKYQKEKKDLIDYLKKQLNKDFEKNAIKLAMDKLSICEQNLENIKSEINNKNNPEDILVDWEERKDLMEKEFSDTQTMVNNFLNGRGASLSKPGNKNTKNKNKAKKKRNFSANPYNKKLNYKPKRY
jgi:hypothetical protein